MRLAVRPKPSCSSTSKCSITDTVCTPRSAIRVPWSLNRRNRSVKLSQKSWGGCPLQLCALNPVSSKAGELQKTARTARTSTDGVRVFPVRDCPCSPCSPLGPSSALELRPLPFPLPQRRLDDLLRHAGVLPLHEVVRREGPGQRLPVDVVEEEVRGEPLLLELDQIGQQVGGG